MPLPKTCDLAAMESRLYPLWEASGAFACNPASKATPYTIMIPPPNVTGSLHMGHGLTFTLQDILIRFRRMQKRDTLWQPGTDHAGIATQMVVERQLAAQGQDRRAIGRKAFLEKVWAWKAESGGTITRQLRRLGASPDWARERFTMDEGLNKAVTKVFVQLYREKLIYKDTRLVNWDPKLLTAVSDLEVESKEIRGSLWHIRYPIEGSDESIIVATTRPETMLGDTAVAVHPDNPKLKHLIGRRAILPLVGRRIPIVADEYADPEKGTGAVKITPAHDFNDFEVAKRHNLPMISVLDRDARIALKDNAGFWEGIPPNPDGAFLDGLDRFEARKRLVTALEERGFLEKIEPHTHAVPHGDRSGVPIEPRLSEQWYCDAKTLAAPALKAVEEGRTRFVPAGWENTYYAWMRNIEPWCISRQLWWGHQIPAWYGPDGQVFVAETEAEAEADAARHYGKNVALTRDEDVLDTWFSSALWPFSTLGWPNATPELTRYYPTDVLVTGFDIIFFWVARMMMMGLHFMKDVPFRTVYIHALVRDAKGQKMSKTKGNVIDPLDMIDAYGADALRFTLASLSTPGRDIRLDPARIEGNRNFTTKLWNLARYAEMNGCARVAGFDPARATATLNRWITGETKLFVDRLTEHLDAFRFDLAASAAYDFVWNTVCDWYVEFTKPVLTGADGPAKTETQATLAWVLDQVLIALHPLMPYVTEEIWSARATATDGAAPLLMTTAWPSLPESLLNAAAQEEINAIVRVIGALRTVRAELNVPAGAVLRLEVKDASPLTRARLATHEAALFRLARLESVAFVDKAPPGSAQTVVNEATFILPLGDVMDLEQERARLAKESAKWEAEAKKLEAKLGNPAFVAGAPPEVVEEHRERQTAARAMIAKLDAARKSLATG